MFEFSIKSTKNVKELTIVFEDGELITQGSKKKDLDSRERSPKAPEPEVQETKEENFLSFDDLDKVRTSNDLIVQKPTVPDVRTINVASELHNLDL